MSKRPVQPRSNLPARLIVGVFRLALELFVIYAIWRWILPDFDVELPLFVVVLVMVAWGAFGVVRFVLGIRVLRKPQMLGLPSLVGSVGKVVSPLAPQGTVRVKGETWMAILDEGGRVEVGDDVIVTDMDELLRLHVRRGRSPEKANIV